MKKIITLLIMITALLTVPQTARAATTFYIGRTIGGTTTVDNTYNGGLSATTAGFTYTKDLKVLVEYQFGKTEYSEALTTELLDIKAGYPIVNNKNGFIYLTLGVIDYAQNRSSTTIAGMLGADVFSIISQRCYFEWDLQYSAWGASLISWNSTTVLPVEAATVKFNLQYILTDHLGLFVNYRLLHFNVANSKSITNVYSPAIGLMYKF